MARKYRSRRKLKKKSNYKSKSIYSLRKKSKSRYSLKKKRTKRKVKGGVLTRSQAEAQAQAQAEALPLTAQQMTPEVLAELQRQAQERLAQEQAQPTQPLDNLSESTTIGKIVLGQKKLNFTEENLRQLFNRVYGPMMTDKKGNYHNPFMAFTETLNKYHNTAAQKSIEYIQLNGKNPNDLDPKIQLLFSNPIDYLSQRITAYSLLDIYKYYSTEYSDLSEIPSNIAPLINPIQQRSLIVEPKTKVFSWQVAGTIFLIVFYKSRGEPVIVTTKPGHIKGNIEVLNIVPVRNCILMFDNLNPDYSFIVTLKRLNTKLKTFFLQPPISTPNGIFSQEYRKPILKYLSGFLGLIIPQHGTLDHDSYKIQFNTLKLLDLFNDNLIKRNLYLRDNIEQIEEIFIQTFMEMHQGDRSGEQIVTQIDEKTLSEAVDQTVTRMLTVYENLDLEKIELKTDGVVELEDDGDMIFVDDQGQRAFDKYGRYIKGENSMVRSLRGEISPPDWYVPT